MRLNKDFYNSPVTVTSMRADNCSYVKTDGGRSESGFTVGKKQKRDCVPRAIAILLNKPYKKVWGDLYERQYKAGYDFNPDKGVITHVWQNYLAEHGYKYFCVKKSRKYVLPKDIPMGKVLLHTRGHIAACIDHTIYDNWDSRTKKSKPRKLYGYVVIE